MFKAMLRFFDAFLTMTLVQRAGKVCKEKEIAKQESVEEATSQRELILVNGPRNDRLRTHHRQTN